MHGRDLDRPLATDSMPARRRRRALVSALLPSLLSLLVLIPLSFTSRAAHGAAPPVEVTLEAVKAALQECQQYIDAADCVAGTLYGTRVEQLLNEIADGIEAREAMQFDYSAHVCREGIEAAEPVPLASEVWEHEGSGAKMRVDTLFEVPRGQAAVYLTHDFISAEECRELRDRGGEMDEAGEYGSLDRKPARKFLMCSHFVCGLWNFLIRTQPHSTTRCTSYVYKCL